LEQSILQNPDCEFLEFSFDEKQLYSQFVHCSPGQEEWLVCWHSTSRYIARFFVREEIDWIFFLDADEIVEGGRFCEWLQNWTAEERAVWFSAYTYGLQAHERRKEVQMTGLLIHKEALTPHRLLNPQERCGIFLDVLGRKRMQVVGLNGEPMIHHYSWVRSAEEQLCKARTWSKKEQQNWPQWLEEQKALVFDRVTPYFDPLSVSIPKGEVRGISLPNRSVVSRRQILQKELDVL